MILEAFSEVLHRERRRTGQGAEEILHHWLLGILTDAEPQDMISRVIHTEITLMTMNRQFAFVGKSATGERLLDSLYKYCDSYENWQFGRWLHGLKPHYFGRQS